jgi:cell division protein FtsB
MRPASANGSWIMRILRWKLMLPLNLVMIGFIGWSYAREASRGAEVSDQLTALREEIASLDKQSRDYKVLIGKLGTDGFVEREARLKLGYQKPGEQTLILREGGSAPTTALVELATADPSATNPQKWWDYFFRSR